jgi:hypothetical protein
MAVRSEIDNIYLRHIKPLPRDVRLRLLSIIASDLATDDENDKSQQRSILELRGLGAEIWQGVDAQQYVDELRDEWEREV